MNTDWIRCDERDTVHEGGVTLIKKSPLDEPKFLVVEVNEREWAGGTGYEIVVGEVDLESDLVPWTIVPVFYPKIKQPYAEVTDPKQLVKLWMLFRQKFFGMRVGLGTKEQLHKEFEVITGTNLEKLGIKLE